ncbi:MAG: DUF6308 family protein, partial [Actinomycetota bacterium]|nr:DUF6308 family protein [Actinomycetota bacterium]
MPSSEVLRWVQANEAVDHLGAYFSAKDSYDRHRYGVGFDLFAVARDGSDAENRITAEDLVATSFLSVDIPGWVAQDILDGQLGKLVSTWLQRISPTVNIGSEKAARLLAK